MKKLALLAVVLTIVPTGARAEAGCSALTDPLRDVYLADLETGEHVPGAPAVDLRGVTMGVEADLLAVHLDVRDVDAEATMFVRRVSYEVSWTGDARRVTVHAARAGGLWRFDWRDSDGGGGDLGASIDTDTNRISMWLPLADAAGAASSLHDIRARSEGSAARTPPLTDHAPNRVGWAASIPLDGTCTVGSADACLVVDGAAQDPAPRAGLDLRAVSLSALPTTMVARIAVADLADAQPGTAERWELAWVNPRFFDGDEHQLAWAERDGERVEFGFARGATQVSATGMLDGANDLIEIVVPREHLGLLDGTRLGGLHATSWEGNGNVWSSMDTENGTPWVVAPTCGATAEQVCPIVLDRGGDARHAEASDDAPQNYAGLDLRGVGVTPSDELVTLAARVTDLEAPEPPAADVAGWTISWLDGDRRVYAQAERSIDGLVFRYGARPPEGEAPAGPTFAGTATTGRLDLARDLVQIDVPRWVLPADGTTLEGFGATGWALSGRNTAAVYLVWDETVGRPYQAGAACSA